MQLRLEIAFNPFLVKENKQAQICAEGCEEEYITHIFRIYCQMR